MSPEDVAKYANLYATHDPVTATAVALAESGGNPTITHTNTDGSIDTGLWQINSVHRRTHPSWTVAWLRDPQHNAEAMNVVSSNGSDWSAWSTFKSGAYKAHLATARKAVDATSGHGGPTPSNVAEVITNPVDVLKGVPEAIIGSARGILDAVNRVGAWVSDPHNWTRVGFVVGGTVLVLVAASAVAAETKAGQATVGTAARAL